MALLAPTAPLPGGIDLEALVTGGSGSGSGQQGGKSPRLSVDTPRAPANSEESSDGESEDEDSSDDEEEDEYEVCEEDEDYAEPPQVSEPTTPTPSGAGTRVTRSASATSIPSTTPQGNGSTTTLSKSRGSVEATEGKGRWLGEGSDDDDEEVDLSSVVTVSAVKKSSNKDGVDLSSDEEAEEQVLAVAPPVKKPLSGKKPKSSTSTTKSSSSSASASSSTNASPSPAEVKAIITALDYPWGTKLEIPKIEKAVKRLKRKHKDANGRIHWRISYKHIKDNFLHRFFFIYRKAQTVIYKDPSGELCTQSYAKVYEMLKDIKVNLGSSRATPLATILFSSPDTGHTPIYQPPSAKRKSASASSKKAPATVDTSPSSKGKKRKSEQLTEVAANGKSASPAKKKSKSSSSGGGSKDSSKKKLGDNSLKERIGQLSALCKTLEEAGVPFTLSLNLA